LLEKTGNTVPYVIIANKQDLPNNMSEKKIREFLEIGPNVSILKTIATQGTGVKKAFGTLIDKIMESDEHVG
jgi:signal recognition particle receptor subunit beta